MSSPQVNSLLFRSGSEFHLSFALKCCVPGRESAAEVVSEREERARALHGAKKNLPTIPSD